MARRDWERKIYTSISRTQPLLPTRDSQSSLIRYSAAECQNVRSSGELDLLMATTVLSSPVRDIVEACVLVQPSK